MEKKVTITKQMISDHIHTNMGLAKSVTEKLILEIFTEISAILKGNGNIQLPNFGSFSIYKKNERPGMNMHTKERMMIAPREVIRFVPSRTLKNRVNGEE